MLNNSSTNKYNKLTPEEEGVIVGKGTEAPFSGKYDKYFKDGFYTCKRCGAKLFKSDSKFDAGCGWPSFDDEVPGAINKILDKDGVRTEILCNNCQAHLGHIFIGENMTEKNKRYCANSLSLNFFEKKEFEEIILGGGCFWCVEAVFQGLDGIEKVNSGYSGGSTINPTYNDVSLGNTGHAEVVRLKYNSHKIKLEKILKIFFLIHDVTTLNRQGNDIGTQYRSVIYFTKDSQEKIVKNFIKNIQSDYKKKIVTEVKRLNKFYIAEDYHQRYFEKNPNQAYCQAVIKPKLDKLKNKIK
jgi:peptide methionine sulfoxide reductase msrA/msrB